MRLTFTIEFTRDDPEPERESAVDSYVEMAQPTVGFAVPEMHMDVEEP